MRKLFFDFETLYTDEYSLKKMTPVEYILHPQFEALGCAFVAGKTKRWVDGPDLPALFQAIDWGSTCAISHNALFDALILKLRYNVVPFMYGDTLSMAQNWLRHSTDRVSLAALSKHYGLPEKMDTLLRTKGVNFHALTQDPHLHQEVATYAMDDAEKCQTIYHRMLADGFPESQLDIIDMVIRMTTEAKFELDATLLAEHMADLKAKKEQLLVDAQLGDDPTNLGRNAAFAFMLYELGVNPVPTKPSPAKPDTQIYAFAKTDKEFTALLDHENPLVQALVAARLGHKSTLEETRTQHFINIANITDRIPVPLKYSGAHTHRFSGDWKLNMQNLPNGSKLRHALRAPAGMKVVSVDASQIEARIVATLAGQHDLVDAFKEGRDVYAEFAANIYHRKIDKARDKRERDIGKVAVLSLGYGANWVAFQNMCRNKAGIKLLDNEAVAIVSIYRNLYQYIKSMWNIADRTILLEISEGREALWGPMKLRKNAILLPSGNLLRYRDLQFAVNGEGRGSWTYKRGNQTNHIYGAKLVENVTQALAFVHLMEVALRVKEITNGQMMPSHQVHDELIYVVPAALAEQVGELVRLEMSKSPAWLPELPLAAETNIGVTYGDT